MDLKELAKILNVEEKYTSQFYSEMDRGTSAKLGGEISDYVSSFNGLGSTYPEAKEEWKYLPGFVIHKIVVKDNVSYSVSQQLKEGKYDYVVTFYINDPESLSASAAINLLDLIRFDGLERPRADKFSWLGRNTSHSKSYIDIDKSRDIIKIIMQGTNNKDSA